MGLRLKVANDGRTYTLYTRLWCPVQRCLISEAGIHKDHIGIWDSSPSLSKPKRSMFNTKIVPERGYGMVNHCCIRWSVAPPRTTTTRTRRKTMLQRSFTQQQLIKLLRIVGEQGKTSGNERRR